MKRLICIVFCSTLAGCAAAPADDQAEPAPVESVAPDRDHDPAARIAEDLRIRGR